MNRIGATAALASLLLLSACGRGDETPGQPSADERRSLDNVAKKLDDQGTIDTSPDSMVPAEEGPVAGNGAAPDPVAAPAPVNSANAAAPR